MLADLQMSALGEFRPRTFIGDMSAYRLKSPIADSLLPAPNRPFVVVAANFWSCAIRLLTNTVSSSDSECIVTLQLNQARNIPADAPQFRPLGTVKASMPAKDTQRYWTQSHVGPPGADAQLLVRERRAALSGCLVAIKLVGPYLHEFNPLGPIGGPIVGATNFVLFLMTKCSLNHV